MSHVSALWSESVTHPTGGSHVTFDLLKAPLQLSHLKHEVQCEWQQAERL